jgi:superoxide reductase
MKYYVRSSDKMERGQIYRCNTCGNMFELIMVGGGSPTCCGSELELLSDAPKDVGAEKHIPIIEKTASGVKVKVGSVPHPMEETHYIAWIEIITDKETQRAFLKPGEAPEADFMIDDTSNLIAKEYCTVHGLWRS